MTIAERNNKLKHFITCLKCEVSGNPCNDNCSTQYDAGNMGEIIENLEAISKALEQESSWIPVSERLPEEYRRVLVSTDAEEIFFASYLGKMDDGTDCFDDEDGMMWEGDVIAWMPLPKPYKAEKE